MRARMVQELPSGERVVVRKCVAPESTRAGLDKPPHLREEEARKEKKRK